MRHWNAGHYDVETMDSDGLTTPNPTYFIMIAVLVVMMVVVKMVLMV
jgi:hypothetical protein